MNAARKCRGTPRPTTGSPILDASSIKTTLRVIGTVTVGGNPTAVAITNDGDQDDEDERVFVKESLLPQGGEGLFAKKDFKMKELICLFNGVKKTLS